MIYLDNGATTFVHHRVKEKLIDIIDNHIGNPSSLHQLGLDAEKKIKEARFEVAKLFKGKEKNIIFTSGGSESNNLAIKGILGTYANRGNHIIISSIEHASIFHQVKKLQKNGIEVSYLPVDDKGFVDSEELKKLIRKDTLLISIMHVNNEIGTIQKLEEIGKIIKEKNSNTIFHIDAVASFGKLPIEFIKWNADIISISGHKIHAPKGVGALFVKDNLKLNSLIDGGSQEWGMRAGTENVAGIVALGEACKIINEESVEKYLPQVEKINNYLRKRIIDEISDSRINGSECRDGEIFISSPYVINLGFKGVKAETLLHHLASNKVYVSTTSACSSKESKENSRILSEIKVPKAYMEGSIRVTFNKYTTIDEIDEFIKILKDGIEMLRMFRR